MKHKTRQKVIGMLGILFLLPVMLTGCSDKKNDDKNYFGGKGEIQYSERLNGQSALYDDENKYFDSESGTYLKLDKNNLLTVNCNIASCLHNDDSCEAYVSHGEYFVFHDKLYKAYNEAEYGDAEISEKGYIADCDKNKVVFDNPVPEDMDEELAVDDSTEIFYVRVINDDVVKVEGHRHAYLLNDKFEILYWYSDIGKFPWGTIYNNKYYYVNDLYQLVCVDMDTCEKSIIELDTKVFSCDSEGDYIYYTDEFKELYKYSIKDNSSIKIANNILLFAVYDGYIYYANTDNSSIIKKSIIDTDGKFVADYSECINMGTDNILKIGDKMYTSFEGGVAEMSPDGKDYKEYTLE